MPEPPVVYYDASCPLCRTEIELLSALRPGALALRDCSAVGFSDAEAESHGITQEHMMQALHVRDAAGRWHVGVNALAVTYRAAGLDAIAWLLALPWLGPLWKRCYRWFARHRRVLPTVFGAILQHRRARPG